MEGNKYFSAEQFQRQPVYAVSSKNKKIGRFLLVGPFVGLITVLLIYKIVAFTSGSTFADPQNISVGMNLVRIILGFIGITCAIGVLAGIPLGFIYLNKKELVENKNLNNIQSSIGIPLKNKMFRWPILIMPFFAIILGIFYLTDLSLFFFWHPILTPLVKLIYFPFFIFPERVADKIYFSGWMPNTITIGFAIVLSLSVLSLISRLIIYALEKYFVNKILVIILNLIFLFSLFLAPSFILANFDQKKCEAAKEKKAKLDNFEEHTGLLEFGLWGTVNQFKNAKNKLKLFYSLNDVSYLYDGAGTNEIVIMTKQGEEIKKACQIETNPKISLVRQVSVFDFIGTKLWKEKRNKFCEAKGFNSEEIKQCMESTLSNSSRDPSQDYKVTDDGIIVTTDKDPVDALGNYSDEHISLKIDKNKFRIGTMTKTGHSYDDVNSGKFFYSYNIYYKIPDFEKINGVYMNIHVPNLSDLSIIDPMRPQFQIINESRIRLGNYEYLRKILTGGYGSEYAFYSTQVEGKEIEIYLISRQYFEDYPDLQREFEEIIASIKFKF